MLSTGGLIHCDLNEHNIMVHENGRDITIIDFPQVRLAGLSRLYVFAHVCTPE
jgi:RIO-like serine/threonine protein kinase